MNKGKIKFFIKAILSILFLGCLLDWPYSYYEMVRFIGMIGFIWLFVLDNENPMYKYLWLASAVLINPLFKIALGRELWNILDIVWVVIFVATELKVFVKSQSN